MEKLAGFIYESVKAGSYISNSKGVHPILNFKKFAYELVTGTSYRKLIENRQILKGARIIDYLTNDEKRKLEIIEKQLIFLISKGFDFRNIKALKLKVV